MLRVFLVEIHIYQVPCDRWIERQKLAKGKVVHYATSSGFIRVSPALTLSDLRRVFPCQLDGEILPRNFVFLRRVGRNFTQVKKHQENELKVKNYIPPFASDPEIYIKESQNTRRSSWLQEEDSGVDELIDIQGQRSQDGSISPSDASPYNLSSGLPSPLTENLISPGGESGVMNNETISRRRAESAEISKKERGAVFQGFSRRSKITNSLYESGSGSQHVSRSIKSSTDSTPIPMEAKTEGKQRQIDYFDEKVEGGKLFQNTQGIIGRATTTFIKDEHCDEETRSNVDTTIILENDTERHCNEEAGSNEANAKFTGSSREKHCDENGVYNGATKLIIGADARKYCRGEVGSQKGEECLISEVFSKLPKRKVAELTRKKSGRKSVKKIKSCSSSRLPVFIGHLKHPLSRAGQEKGRYNIKPAKVFPKRTMLYSSKCQGRPTSDYNTYTSGQHRPISVHSNGTCSFVENVNKLTKASKLPRLVQNMKVFSRSDNATEKIKHAKINQSKVPQLTKREILTTTNRRINRLATKGRKSGIHNGKRKLINCSKYETIVDSRKNNERFIDQPDDVSRENITRKKATFTVSREYKTQTETWKRFQQIWRQLVETGSFQKRPFLLKRDFTDTNQLVWDKTKNSLILKNVPVTSKVSTFKIFPGVNLKMDYAVNNNVHSNLTELTYTEGNRRPSKHTPLSVKDTLMTNGHDTPFSVTSENVKMNFEHSNSVITRNAAVLSSINVNEKENERSEQNGSMFKLEGNVKRNYVTQHEVDSVRGVRSKQKSGSGIHISNLTNQITTSTTGCAEKNSLCRKVVGDISMNTTGQTTKELECPSHIFSIITSENSGGGNEHREKVNYATRSKRSKQKLFHKSGNGLENKNCAEVRNNTIEQLDNQTITGDITNAEGEQRDETKLNTNFNIRRNIKGNEFVQNYTHKNKEWRVEQKCASKDKSGGVTNNRNSRNFSVKMSIKTDVVTENKERFMDTRFNTNDGNYDKRKKSRGNIHLGVMSEYSELENCYLNINSPNETRADESVARSCNLSTTSGFIRGIEHLTNGTELNTATTFTNNNIPIIDEEESKKEDQNASESNVTAKNKGNESPQHLTAKSNVTAKNKGNESPQHLTAKSNVTAKNKGNESPQHLTPKSNVTAKNKGNESPQHLTAKSNVTAKNKGNESPQHLTAKSNVTAKNKGNESPQHLTAKSNVTAKNKGNESPQHLTARSRESRPNSVLSDTPGFGTHCDSLGDSGVELSARTPNSDGKTISNCDETSKRVLVKEMNSSVVTIIYDSCKPGTLRNYHITFRDVYKSPYDVENETQKKNIKTNIQNNYETDGHITADRSSKQVKDIRNSKRPVNFQLRRSRSDSDSLAIGRLRQVKSEATKSCHKDLNRKYAMSSFDLAEDEDLSSRVAKLRLILDHIILECRMSELKRENMLRRVKQLQLKASEKSDQVKSIWKKRYVEERNKSTPLEHECARYRNLLQKLHRELLAKMEFGFGNNNFAGKAGLPSSRLSAKISTARLLQEIEDLKQRVESTKFRLTAETKVSMKNKNEFVSVNIVIIF
ncbi:uncharacterized protein LOC111089795 [Limulus polyphemus]|uniref:Uncharacterized protein LOC111089795 n=1 Tax=Limulus polyphemus TaxID=6850 RepID=A0ABM1TRU1_LIMPO|nr:uncharacterized protein LOC111089795 [Limulus polyphemus]